MSLRVGRGHHLTRAAREKKKSMGVLGRARTAAALALWALPALSVGHTVKHVVVLMMENRYGVRACALLLSVAARVVIGRGPYRAA